MPAAGAKATAILILAQLRWELLALEGLENGSDLTALGDLDGSRSSARPLDAGRSGFALRDLVGSAFALTDRRGSMNVEASPSAALGVNGLSGSALGGRDCRSRALGGLDSARELVWRESCVSSRADGWLVCAAPAGLQQGLRQQKKLKALDRLHKRNRPCC